MRVTYTVCISRALSSIPLPNDLSSSIIPLSPDSKTVQLDHNNSLPFANKKFAEVGAINLVEYSRDSLPSLWDFKRDGFCEASKNGDE